MRRFILSVFLAVSPLVAMAEEKPSTGKTIRDIFKELENRAFDDTIDFCKLKNPPKECSTFTYDPRFEKKPDPII